MEHEDTKKPPPPGEVFELAERAVEYVRKATQIVLDYTPETLPLLDHYLRGVPADQAETVALVAATAGAYFGEVARRLLDGEWRDASRLVLGAGLQIRPAALARAAITKEDGDDGEPDDYDVPAAARAAVEDALANIDVPVDEYYSLSGRLETIQLICDVIATTLGAGQVQ
jgi:hypothetical protein